MRVKKIYFPNNKDFTFLARNAQQILIILIRLIKMQKKVKLIFTLLTIFLFLGIRTGYNFAPPFSLFSFIKEDILHFSSFNWKLASYTKTWAFVSYEMILGLVFLLISLFLKNKFWLLLSSFLLFAMWLKNYILYSGIMDADLYLKSSTYFLLSLILLNIFNLFLKKSKST